jgi:hypothetical protein
VVSTVANEAMASGDEDDATTTSETTIRSYASVVAPAVSAPSSDTLPTPTAVNVAAKAVVAPAVSAPSSDTLPTPAEVKVVAQVSPSATASGESSAYLSQIAALQKENAELRTKLATQARDPTEFRTTAASEISAQKAAAKLATQPRDPTESRSTAALEISDPTPTSASKRKADPDGYIVSSPPRPRRTTALDHTPPSRYDSVLPTKRSRNGNSTFNSFAVLAPSPDEDDEVNNTAAQVSALTLEKSPRSSTSEPGMRL